jgi:hypothetical protein
MTKAPKVMIEDINLQLVGDSVLTEAEQWLSACESCAKNAFIPFEYILDILMACDPTIHYEICRPARCPSCFGEVTEGTLVAI